MFQDINDHTPQFEAMEYVADVPEDVSIGIDIFLSSVQYNFNFQFSAFLSNYNKIKYIYQD